jgi:chromosome segregation ATPase
MAEVSKVDEALARFEAALRRLEAAIMRADENGHERSPDAASLLDEREQLAHEISEVRAKANELAERNRNAASKIDSAMAKIKLVLG